MDKGYACRDGYMVPYNNTRYHQKQWVDTEPEDAKEAFNKVHSSLRSCIERCFGVLKARWKILRQFDDGFSLDTQVDIILSCFALNNYILHANSGADYQESSGGDGVGPGEGYDEESGSEEVEEAGREEEEAEAEAEAADAEARADEETDSEEEAEDPNYTGSTKELRDHIAGMLWARGG